MTLPFLKKKREKEIENSMKMKSFSGGEVSQLLKKASSMSKEERKEFLDSLERDYVRLGMLALEKAYQEGVLTEKEYHEEWYLKRGIEPDDMATILHAYFQSKKIKEDNFIVTTTSDSTTYKNREFIKEKLGVDVKDPMESMKAMYDNLSEEEKKEAGGSFEASMKKAEEAMRKKRDEKEHST